MSRPPKSKTHCYDKFFLRKDMENMGYLFEYCNKYCKELFNVDIDELKFLNAFMKSKCRYTMETGHERLLSQAAVDTVEMFIKVDCDGDAKQFERTSNSQYDFCYHQLYWVGMMYAYMHYRADMLSKDLIKLFPLDLMLEHYYLGHEMSREAYFDHIKHVFLKVRQQANLERKQRRLAEYQKHQASKQQQ